MKTKQAKNKGSFSILKKIMGIFMLSILLMACESNNDEQSATVHVRLTDTPGDFQQVNIDIQGLEVHSDLGDQNSSWRTLTDTVATAYSDDAGNFLVRGVPAGTYTVGFDPKDGYIPMQKDGVIVMLDYVTNVGTVVIL